MENLQPEKVPFLQPPSSLADGFLNFAKGIKKKADDNGGPLPEDLFTKEINNDLSGAIRLHFLFWIMDLNQIIQGINILLSDFYDLINDRNAFKGDPTIRMELMVVSFFGEFFRLKEISKIYFKIFYKYGFLNDKTKKFYSNAYYIIFEKYYEIRNEFVHQGLSFADENVNLDWSIFDDLPTDVKTKFVNLLNQANTKENALEIRCALFVKFIRQTMDQYLEFQDKINEVLADLVIAFENDIISESDES